MRKFAILLSLAMSATAAPVWAQAIAPPEDIAPLTAAEDPFVLAQPEPLSLASLEAESAQGSETMVLSDQQLAATNSGNSVVANVLQTGDVAFSANALAGFSGVGNFVINTGNNSNIQGAISVTIVTIGPSS